MANNFLRFKLLMLSRASSMEIYTAAREIFATLRAYPTAKIADALNVEAFMDGAFSAKSNADVADTIKREAVITGETEVKCESNVALTQSAMVDIEGDLQGEALATIYGGINARSNIVIDAEFVCSPKVLKKEYKPVIREEENLDLTISANVANLLKVAIEAITKELPVEVSHKLANSVLCEAVITGETEVKCESNVAIPIDYEVRSLSTGDISVSVKMSAPLNAFAEGGITEEVACNPTLLKRARLSDFSSQRLSDLQEMTLSDLKYKEINL